MNALVHILKDYSIGKFYASRDFLYIFLCFIRHLCIFMHSCLLFFIFIYYANIKYTYVRIY